MTDIISELNFGGQVASSFFSTPTSTNSANLIRFNQPSKELNERYHNMHSNIANLRAKSNRNWRALSRFPFIQHMFDPSYTADMISFFALGGLDAIIEVMCDDELFLTVETASQARLARNVCQDYIRLVDEAMIVNGGGVSWYILLNYPKFIHRVIAFMELDKVRDRCFTLLEHLTSFIGPLWRISTNKELKDLLLGVFDEDKKKVLLKASDVLYCKVFRLLSTSVIPSVIAGPSADIEYSVPYPQGWGSRLKQFHLLAGENSRYIAQYEIMKRLVHLIDYSRDTTSRGQSNNNNSGSDQQQQQQSSSNNSIFQTRTVEHNGQQVQAIELDANSLQSMMMQSGMMTTAMGGIGGGTNANTNNNNNAGGGGNVDASVQQAQNMLQMLRMLQTMSGGQMSVQAQVASEVDGGNSNNPQTISLDHLLGGAVGNGDDFANYDEDEEGEEDDEEGEEDAGGFGDQLTQLLSGLAGGAGGGIEQDDDGEGAQPDFRGANQLNAEDNAMLFSRFLTELAQENAVNNNEEGYVDDTAECPWLLGEPDAERMWSLFHRNFVIDHHDNKNTGETDDEEESWISSAKDLIETIRSLAPTPLEEKEAKKKKERLAQLSSQNSNSNSSSNLQDERKELQAHTLAERKTIIHNQSEMLYLMTALISGVCGAQSWVLLNKLKVGNQIYKMLKWFVEVQPTIDATESKAQSLMMSDANPLSSVALFSEADFKEMFPANNNNNTDNNHEHHEYFTKLSLRRLLHREERIRMNIIDQEQYHRLEKLQKKMQREEEVVNESGGIHYQSEKLPQSSLNVEISGADELCQQQQNTNDKNNKNDDNIVNDVDDDIDAISIATSIEQNSGGHHHSLDLLCKIEAVRFLQEFWDARHCGQAFLVYHSHLNHDNNNDNNNNENNTTSLATLLFNLIIKYIKLGRAEDACLENMCAFCVEARLRGLCVIDRPPIQKQILQEIAIPMLDRLMIRSPKGVAALRNNHIHLDGPLPPFDHGIIFHRRIDNCMTIVGDACRYNLPGWSMIEHWMLERGMMMSMSMSSSSSSTTTTNQRSLFKYLLLSCTQHISLFLRAFFLTKYQHLLCCPVLMSTNVYDWKQRQEQEQDLQHHQLPLYEYFFLDCSKKTEKEDCSDEEHQLHLSRARRYVEPSYTVCQRIFAIRKLMSTSEFEKFILGSEMNDDDELFNAIEEVASNHCIVEKKDQVRWFSSSSLSEKQSSSAPKLNSQGAEKVAEYQNNTTADHLMKTIYCPQLHQLLTKSLLVPIIARLLIRSNAADVESIDKVHITTPLIIFGGILREAGKETLQRVIQSACRHHQLRRRRAFEKFQKRKQQKKMNKKAREEDNDEHNNNNINCLDCQQEEYNFMFQYYENNLIAKSNKSMKDCDRALDDDSDFSDSSDEDEDEDQNESTNNNKKDEKEKSRFCLHCGAERKYRRYNVLRIPCAARCFFEGLCIWISHYCIHPTNIHAVYYTTQIDLPFWKEIVRTIIPILRENFA